MTDDVDERAGKPTVATQRTSDGRFKKGTSGNPAGRPKRTREFLERRSRKLVKELYRIAMKPDEGIDNRDKIAALRECLRIVDAYPSTKIEQQTTITESPRTEDLSTEEVVRRQLELVAGGKK